MMIGVMIQDCCSSWPRGIVNNGCLKNLQLLPEFAFKSGRKPVMQAIEVNALSFLNQNLDGIIE